MNINLAHRRDSRRHKSRWVRNLPGGTFQKSVCLSLKTLYFEGAAVAQRWCTQERLPHTKVLQRFLAGYSFSRFPRDKKQRFTSGPRLKCVRRGTVCSRFPVISLCSTQRCLHWEATHSWPGCLVSHVQAPRFLQRAADMNGLPGPRDI